jgi:hypothetical protein
MRADVCPDGSVVEHVELRERARRLEDRGEPMAGTAMRRPVRNVAAAYAHVARLHEVEAGDAAEERRLPGAVRSDQAGERAGRDVERHVIDRPDRTEGFRNVDELASGLVTGLRCERDGSRRTGNQAT